MVGKAFAYVALGTLAASSAYGACTKPQAPSCAIAGAFAKASDQDQCRMQMIPYRASMEGFAECLKGEGQDEKPALDELAHTLAEFNRRSRELPADGL